MAARAGVGWSVRCARIARGVRGGFGAIWPVADLLGEEEWREEGKEESQGKCARYRDVSRHSEGKEVLGT